MNQHVSIPGWDDFSVQLKEDLNYSETMLERTFYTYRSFVPQRKMMQQKKSKKESTTSPLHTRKMIYQKISF